VRGRPRRTRRSPRRRTRSLRVGFQNQTLVASLFASWSPCVSEGGFEAASAHHPERQQLLDLRSAAVGGYLNDVVSISQWPKDDIRREHHPIAIAAFGESHRYRHRFTVPAQQPRGAIVERLGERPLDVNAFGAEELEVRDGPQRRAGTGAASKHRRFANDAWRRHRELDLIVDRILAAID